MQNTYDEMMEDLGGHKHVHRIKDGLKSLRKSVADSKLQEGLLHSSLFHYSQQ